jgi:putative RecB family exonuclease
MIAATPDHAGNWKLTPPTPGDTARALTGRDYLSWSQVSTFQACSLKWHFSYVEQAKPERVSAALLLGSSIHAAIQHHLECQLAGDVQPSPDELIHVFQTTWKEEANDTPIEYSREDDEQSQVDTARRMIDSFLASPHSKVEGQTLAIEEMLRVSLDPNLPDLVTKLDHIGALDHELVG